MENFYDDDPQRGRIPSMCEIFEPYGKTGEEPPATRYYHISWENHHTLFASYIKRFSNEDTPFIISFFRNDYDPCIHMFGVNYGYKDNRIEKIFKVNFHRRDQSDPPNQIILHVLTAGRSDTLSTTSIDAVLSEKQTKLLFPGGFYTRDWCEDIWPTRRNWPKKKWFQVF
jgi:hypothetical protein